MVSRTDTSGASNAPPGRSNSDAATVPSIPSSTCRSTGSNSCSIASAWPSHVALDLGGMETPSTLASSRAIGPQRRSRRPSRSLPDAGASPGSGRVPRPERWPRSRRRRNAAGAATRRCAPTARRRSSTGMRPALRRLANSLAPEDWPPTRGWNPGRTRNRRRGHGRRRIRPRYGWRRSAHKLSMGAPPSQSRNRPVMGSPSRWPNSVTICAMPAGAR